MSAATDTQATVSSALDRIRGRFLDGLDMRILNFENDLAAARRGGDEARPALIEIRNEAHKIAGIAASIGLARTGAEARAIEERIDRELPGSSPAAVLTGIEPPLEAFLDHLEELLEQAGTETAG
ncbi:hypothetical protein E0K89_013130 [Aquicoccus sp. SCR17]|nr:hypothetical protein [Carideicomes alvinocaridis]